MRWGWPPWQYVKEQAHRVLRPRLTISPRAISPPRAETMELDVDGRRVYAATGGRPFDRAKPTTMFVHGAGMDHTVWQLPARWFAWHGHSVLAVDLPGHGRSEGPPLGTVAELAQWLGRVMDAAC